jgi:hypothetical protein
MPELSTKRCTKCGKEKPVSEFYKNNHVKDGLSLQCKGCAKSYYKGTVKTNKDIVKRPDTKRCTKCGREKPVSSFTKDGSSKDGFYSSCKDCKQQFERAYKKLYRKEHPDSQTCRATIDSWQQIDGVLRELAETQLTINDETESIEKRISTIKSQSDETIEPCVWHQIFLQTMLAIFLKKELSKDKRAIRKFQFGKILWNGGKVNIELNTEFAKERLGKP